MLQSRSNVMRLVSLAVTVVFLLVSIVVSTESVDAASKLKVSVTKKTIYVGQTAKFKANKNVKWSVSKKKIAKLTKIKKRSVTVKGLKAGTVYVKAKAGKTTKKVKIVVKAAPKKISLSASNEVIGLGEYSTVFVSSGKKTVASSDVVFLSSDKSIAIVNNRGLVMGLSEGSATITAKSKANTKVKAKIKIKVVAAKAGTIKLQVDLSDESRYPMGKVAKVWLPVPQNDDNQYISVIRCDAPAAKTPVLTTDSEGGKQYYIEWDADTKPADRKATLSYHIYRRAVVRDETLSSKEKSLDKAPLPEEAKKQLNPTCWSGSLTSGIVKETADSIVAAAGAKTVYAKAFAIYDWMCDNMVRTDDKTVIFGDVVSILEGKRNAGSCMDMNSVFVALCRAEGIPARNLFGLRFTTGGPNCRAEFYLPGYGWVPADPALAIKQGRGLDAPPRNDHNATWEGIKDKYWGSGEENWICLNMGRDIMLNPPQSVVTEEYLEVLNPAKDGSSTINLYMFPYGEFDGKYIPCQDRGNFKYEYSFDEEDPVDCGC